MSKLLIVFYLSLCAMCSVSYSQTVNYQTTQIESNNVYVTDLNVATKLGKETKQKIVVIFSASWCGHCTNLKNDFPQIKEFDNKIVCILDSDVEKKLARQFKIRTLPTSIMLDFEGNEINRITGYQKEPYKKWLQSK